MTGELPHCDRCEDPIFKTVADDQDRYTAACGCTEVIGVTDDDIPDHWQRALEPENDP